MNRLHLFVLCAALGLLASCRRTLTEPPVQRVARFADWERAFRAAVASEVRSGGERLVPLEGRPSSLGVKNAATLVLTSQGLFLDGEQVALPGSAPDAVAARLRDLKSRHQRVSPGAPAPFIGIEAEVDAPWSLVVLAAQAIDGAGLRAALVFAGSPPPAIPASSVSPELEKAQAEPRSEARASRWTAAVQSALKDCPSWKQLPENTGHVADPAEFFTAGARSLLAERDCEVETAAIQAALWGLVVDGRKQVGHKLLELRLGQEGAEVVLPGGLPWKDAAAKVVTAARAGPVRLRVAEPTP